MGKNKFRSLVDSGAEVSLIHRPVYKSLTKKPKLLKRNAGLQSVNGGFLEIDGYINLSFKIRNTECTHSFYISPSINRNFILGRDWLVQNSVRLYFDLGKLRIGESTIPLQEDIQIASLVRLRAKTILRPQTTSVCIGKIKDSYDFPSLQLYTVSAIDKGFVGSEPGLMVSNSVAKLARGRLLPILVVNSTYQTIRLSKGCIMAKLEKKC